MASVQTKDYIVQLMKEEILSGVMKPGEELAQEALAERLGVSRMPIREALQNLVQEGFAVRLPNRHIQAVVLSAQQIHDGSREYDLSCKERADTSKEKCGTNESDRIRRRWTEQAFP